MRTINKVIRLLILAAVVCIFTLPGAAYAAPAAAKTVQQKAVQPAGSTVVPGGPVSDGQIANVSSVPASGVWHTGTPVQVQWQWPGYVGFRADVTLWSGSTQTATIASGWSGLSVGWNVPYNITPGVYTIRVQSSSNNKNFAEATVNVQLCKLAVTLPRQGNTLATGSAYQITWTFTGGNPGPLKIELVPAGGSGQAGTQLIADNVPWGNSGAGQYNWQIPGNTVPRNYTIQITSMGNSAMTAASEPFAIAQPSITTTSPNGDDWAIQSTYPITWQTFGNPGSLKIELVSSTNESMIIADNIQSTAGKYDWKVFGSILDEQFYRVRVASMSNSAIAGYSPQFMIRKQMITPDAPCPSNPLMTPADQLPYQPGPIPIKWHYLGNSPTAVKLTITDNDSKLKVFELDNAAIGGRGAYRKGWFFGGYDGWQVQALDRTQHFVWKIEAPGYVFLDVCYPVTIPAKSK